MMGGEKIFIQIACYDDEEIYPTIVNIFENASNSSRIRLGICFQGTNEGIEKFRSFCEESSYSHQIEMVCLNIKYAKGAGFARFLAQGLFRGEEYTLQIDSHHRFVKNWDEKIINQYKALPGTLCVLTSFLPGYTKVSGCQAIDTEKKTTQLFCRGFASEGSPQIIHLAGKIVSNEGKSHTRTPFVVFNFIFANSAIFQKVPIDPSFKFYGDEFSYSVRLWSHGVDVYQIRSVICFHRWETDPVVAKPYKSSRAVESKIAVDRILLLIGKGGDGSTLGVYGLASQRSFSSFCEFAGLDLNNRVLQQKALTGDWI